MDGRAGARRREKESGAKIVQGFGLITHIGPIGEGGEPQMGPSGIPFRIDVHTTAGPGVLELTQKAAADLVKELNSYLSYLRMRGNG
jgi:hypothetical protein